MTDNDGDADDVQTRYKKYGSLVTLCIVPDNTLNTLEPSVLAANSEDFETFKTIIYYGRDIETLDQNSILKFMTNNKTEWSMRVFVSHQKVNYPSYILKAIGKQ